MVKEDGFYICSYGYTFFDACFIVTIKVSILIVTIKIWGQFFKLILEIFFIFSIQFNCFLDK